MINPQVLYVNPSFLKFLPGMNLSPTNPLLYNQSKISHNDVIFLNWLNNPGASCSLVNLKFLLPHTAQLQKSMIFPFLNFLTERFLFFVYFLQFKQDDTSEALLFRVSEFALILTEYFVDPNTPAVFH